MCGLGVAFRGLCNRYYNGIVLGPRYAGSTGIFSAFLSLPASRSMDLGV